MNAPPLHWIFRDPSSLLGSYTAKLEQMELDADERPSEEAYEKEKNLVHLRSQQRSQPNGGSVSQSGLR